MSSPAQPSSRPPVARRGIKVVLRRPKRPWLRRLLIIMAAAGSITLILGAIFWIRVGNQIDARLAGEARPIPRIFGRPFEIYTGRGLSGAELVQRLNDVGYAQRPRIEQPGEFSMAANGITIMTRPAEK